jgi:hypothetical protein
MKCRALAAAILTALVPLALLAAAQAGDKGLDVKGQIKIGNHALKLEAGKLYVVRATGNGFMPVLSINPGFFRGAQGPFERNAVNTVFVPAETREYRLYVVPATYGPLPEGMLDYTLKVTRIPLSNKPLVKEESKLTAEDPPYENKKSFVKTEHHKAFPVKLDAERYYVIDMMRKGKEFDFKDISPSIHLEDPDKKVVASDAFGGEKGNARLVFKAPRAGDYRVIATSTNKEVGPFSLIVRKQLKEKE